MKAIAYAGRDYVTGDDIALALLDYSKGLAEHDRAETVEIPIRNEDGSRGAATFLVGPASQIVAKNVEDTVGEELRDAEAVAHLRALTAALYPVAGPEAARPRTSWSDDDI